MVVVYDIAKIYIWKQITTLRKVNKLTGELFMILQRYTFGSKSQQLSSCPLSFSCCLWYCKDIHLEANHNIEPPIDHIASVVYDIAKIYIWKQITTFTTFNFEVARLFMILQRYTFGSKSQLLADYAKLGNGCLWYCKDIHLEANHNYSSCVRILALVVYDIAKIYIWKQITTTPLVSCNVAPLFMILQRYTFGSKSQHKDSCFWKASGCLWYCKDIHLEANHNLLTF